MSERCVRCGAAFSCGAEAKPQSGAPPSKCWCEELPAVLPVTDEGCLCRNCLSAEIEDQLRQHAGLCAGCRHAKRLATKTGAPIFQCARAANEPRYAKFPRLPVSSCVGFEKP